MPVGPHHSIVILSTAPSRAGGRVLTPHFAAGGNAWWTTVCVAPPVSSQACHSGSSVGASERERTTKGARDPLGAFCRILSRGIPRSGPPGTQPQAAWVPLQRLSQNRDPASVRFAKEPGAGNWLVPLTRIPECVAQWLFPTFHESRTPFQRNLS